MPAGPRIEELFIVRCWREDNDAARVWRGSVEHIGAKQRFYFSNLADLMEFIRIRLANEPERDRA